VEVNNPLTQEFLSHYPMDAARVLEQVSAEHVAALFAELPTQSVLPVLAIMMPDLAAACVEKMPAMPAAKVMTELPASLASRIYHQLKTDTQNELSAYISDKDQNRIRRYHDYPAESAGALLEFRIDMLPENITVGEAIRRVERMAHAVSCDIYVVDEMQHLVGVVSPGQLLKANNRIKLRDIMDRKTHRVSVHATAISLLSHPGWLTRRRLPMVERNNTLAGVLDYAVLQQATGHIDSVSSRDPLASLLSLAGLYWLSVSQLLDSLLTISRPDKGDHL